ncbi:MAG: UDP-2,4-diacetamido-2,4,6-trideoxy-beta-L-altropyranose hydrolase [Sphingomonadales bacterium CG_4_10_14_3_um_filter_58_15]|nr:MAG: UDP-2,4-diacetamido-2,4,6-trideoxy-beta-L-altropyranose hydrolase [Sphingomonadales bacterium CG_4_10_14_3_um_filter_58_15]
MIAFRVDSSIAIGSGHVMRCLALAGELARRGRRCVFVMRDLPGAVIPRVFAEGHEIHLLSPPAFGAAFGAAFGIAADAGVGAATGGRCYDAWLGAPWRDDATSSAAFFATRPISWVVVDHYALDARWQGVARAAGARILAIDDLADRPHAADMILDQTLGRATMDYAALAPLASEILAGPGFALQRPEFSRLRDRSLSRRAGGRIENVLVSMGGMDRTNMTGRMLEALDPISEGLSATVVLGASAPHRAAVEWLSSELPWVQEVVVDAPNMGALMAAADVAIGAAGSTSWERCCLGLPSLMVVLAENQRESCAMLEAAGAGICLGEDDSDVNWAVAMAAAMARLRASGALAAASAAASVLCDGLGAARVADRMCAVS